MLYKGLNVVPAGSSSDHMHIYINSHIQTDIDMYVCTCIYTYTYTHTYIYIDRYVHIVICCIHNILTYTCTYGNLDA